MDERAAKSIIVLDNMALATIRQTALMVCFRTLKEW
jgi:hypothetical protein